MSFSRENVQFDDEDLKAAEALDNIYESLRDAGSFSLGLFIAQVKNIQILADYVLNNSSRESLADRLFDLGVMFKRDNITLSRVSTSEE